MTAYQARINQDLMMLLSNRNQHLDRVINGMMEVLFRPIR